MNDIRAELAFPVLDEQQIERLRIIGAPRIAEDGETLIAEGERGFDFYVVVSGSVEILEHSGGSPTTVTIHKAGEFTGDHWKIIDCLRQYYLRYQTVMPVRMLVQRTGISLRRIQELFPSGFARGACRIAGIPSHILRATRTLSVDPRA